MGKSIAAFLRNPQPRAVRCVCAIVFGAGLVLLTAAYLLLDRNLALQAENTRIATAHVEQELSAAQVLKTADRFQRNRHAQDRAELLGAIHALEVSVNELQTAGRAWFGFPPPQPSVRAEPWIEPADRFLALARSFAHEPRADSLAVLQTEAHDALVDALHDAELQLYAEIRRQIHTLTIAKYIVLAAIFGLSLGEALLVVRPLTAALDRAAERIRRLAEEDGLTGLATRGVFLERAEAAAVDAKGRGETLTLLIFDLDRMRSVNHCFGAGGGNAAISHVASLIGEAAPPGAIAARWDGDEIILMSPHAELGEAIRFGESLRMEIAETPCLVDRHRPLSITVSVGLVRFDPAVESLTEAILRADGNLRRAKLGGRNRVMFGLEDAAADLAA